MRSLPIQLCVPVLAAALVSSSRVSCAADTSRLQFHVRDERSQPLPCQIYLKNEKGEPQRAAGQPFWNDHFVCAGDVSLDLPAGNYDYAVERGPEYERISGTITLTGREHTLSLSLQPISRLREAGWYSADLHVHRPPADIEAVLAAAELDFAPVITWWNQRNLWRDAELPEPLQRQFDGRRFYHLMAGEDEREGGALLYFGLDQPLDITAKNREVPSPMMFVGRAREQDPDVWIDIEKPFWWDVPVWLASRRMNSIGIANNHQCRDRMYANEAWGRPRDADRLAEPLGNGFWTQEIYYHVLNSGLRIPPSAGSASGVLPNPVGYNRVYVHLDEEFTPDSWFRGLAAGRCFVTNGPLLVCRANDRLPGTVFGRTSGDPHRVKLEIELTSWDRVPQIEVIYNGKVQTTIPGGDQQDQKHSVTLELPADGWFLVRAITDQKRTFRFASTGPFYLETAGNVAPISRESAQFFLDWVDERIERVKANVEDEVDREGVLMFHRQAREFWAERAASAP
jgi:hypothetical protein